MGKELLIGVGIAVAMTAFQVLVDFDPSTVTDWRTWTISGGAALVRSAAQAGLQAITTWKLTRGGA